MGHSYSRGSALITAALLMGAPGAVFGQEIETEGAESDVVTSEEVSAMPDDAGTVEDDTQNVDLSYRVWGESLDLADFDGEASDQLNAVYQRARADIGVRGDMFGVRLETDVFTGRLGGDDQPGTPDDFKNSGTRPRGMAFKDLENFLDPRNAYFELSSLALLRLGLQTSNFGTRPFAILGGGRTASKVTVAVGGDYVYRDDNASFIDGDRARQAVGTIYYSDTNPSDPEDQRFLGTYAAYRVQQDANGDELRAMAVDVSGKTSWNDDNDFWYYSLGAEAALITGETTRTYTQTGDFETSVLSLGAVGEAEVRWKPLDMSVKLNFGYASGDANTDDDTLYRHRFDPNYKIGLVLFDHYIPAVTRTGYGRATDPGRSGVPPKGVSGLISDGAVENAIYLNPMLLFGNPDGLLTGVGFLWAQSAVPLYDPFNTFAAGGSPIGVRGAQASRDLGVEVDVAARYRHKIVSDLQIEAKVEYGLLFPGEAFANANGDPAAPQNLARGRLALLW